MLFTRGLSELPPLCLSAPRSRSSLDSPSDISLVSAGKEWQAAEMTAELLAARTISPGRRKNPKIMGTIDKAMDIMMVIKIAFVEKRIPVSTSLPLYSPLESGTAG